MAPDTASSTSPSNGIISFQGKALKLDTAADAAEIVKAIESSSGVHTIILEGNTFGIPAAEAIGKVLGKVSTLKRALFKDIFTSRGKNDVPPALKHLLDGVTESGAQLTELDLSDNAFGPIGMKSVKPFLLSPSCERLEVLRLNNTGLGLYGGEALAEGLVNLINLKVLVVGRNRLTASSTEEEVTSKIGDALVNVKALEVLEMPQNGIRVKGIRSLADVIQRCSKSLRVIDLNDNTVTPKGAKALSRALSTCSSLEVLNLGDCLLKTKGGISILKGILAARPSSLRVLNLSGNEMGGEEFVSLLLSIPPRIGASSSLSIDVSCNGFGSLCQRLEAAKSFEVILEDDEGTNDEDEDDESDEDNESQEIEETDGNCVSAAASSAANEIAGLLGKMSLDDLCQEFVNVTISGFNEKVGHVDQGKLIKSREILEEARKKGSSVFETTSSLLIQLGLLKSEETKKKKQIADLRGPFAALADLAPYLTEEERVTLKVFVNSSEASGAEAYKERLLQKLSS